MANDLGTILQRLRQVIGAPVHEGVSDGCLVERYCSGQEEAAFAELLERHGPMVLGVCRRVVKDWSDAEDAFQATFLVLLRKAGSIVRRESVGSWLYGVAYRISLRARVNADRRHAQQNQVADMASPASQGPPDRFETRPIIDEELQALPEKYRQAMVLCYLEGRTTEQAAQQLGCPFGTVSSRLARGRDLLRTRLTRRGLTVASGAVAAFVAENAAPAAVPATLAKRSLSAAHQMISTGMTSTAGVASAEAAALTEGALKAMWISKLKGLVARIAAAVGLAGSGLLVHQVLAEKPTPLAQAPQEPNAPAGQAVRTTKDDLTPASFAKLHALIRPQDHEWRHLKVQWQTDVVAARKKAAAEDKPILICYTGGAGYNEPLGIC